MQLHNESFEQTIPGRWQIGKGIWKQSSRKGSNCKASNDCKSMKGTDNCPFTLFFQPIEGNFLTFREVEVLWRWNNQGTCALRSVSLFPLYTKVRSRTRAKKKNQPTSQADSPRYISDSKRDMCTKNAGVKASCAFVLGYFLNSWELAGQPHYSKEQ